MLDVTIDNIKSLLSNGHVRFSFIYPMTRAGHFKLHTAVKIKMSNGWVANIPKDFEFDGSSSPRFLWWLFPSYGDFIFAAILHDYLYSTQYMADMIGLKEAQKFADKEMLIWSNKINDRNIGKKIDNYSRFYAVRMFGKKVFRK